MIEDAAETSKPTSTPQGQPRTVSGAVFDIPDFD
jgi:hypothetical protein